MKKEKIKVAGSDVAPIETNNTGLVYEGEIEISKEQADALAAAAHVAEKPKIIYIAGKVTGIDPTAVMEKFAKKQAELEALGCVVYNPIQLIATAEKYFEEQTSKLFNSWSDYMRFLLPYFSNCDELHLLPCWNESKGAILERDLALKLDIPVIHC